MRNDVDAKGQASGANTILVMVGWILMLVALLAVGYKLVFRQAVMKTADCLDQAAYGQRAVTPLQSVEKYAGCLAWQTALVSKDLDKNGDKGRASVPPRCAFAGTWNATRDNVSYVVTLEADGKFTGEPGDNAPPQAQPITGAWAVAGKSLAWAYDKDKDKDNVPVWPPDINPVSERSDKAFTLTEVNGSVTRYVLMERGASALCAQK